MEQLEQAVTSLTRPRIPAKLVAKNLRMQNTSPRLTRSQSGLIVVDIQERLLPAIFEKEQLIQTTVRLIKGAAILGVPIFATEQYRKGLGALQHGERLRVERGRARRADDPAVDHAPLPVEAEEDLLIVVAGDNTVQNAARQLNNSQTALGIIPIGQTNRIAEALKIPEDIEAASTLIGTAQPRRVNLGQILKDEQNVTGSVLVIAPEPGG